MKKFSHSFIIALTMLMLGLASPAEARKGKASSDTPVKSVKSNSVKLSKSPTSPTNKTSSFNPFSSFSRAAKTKQANAAWQEYNKAATSTASQNSIPAMDGQSTAMKKQKERVTNQGNSGELATDMVTIMDKITKSRRERAVINQTVIHQRHTTSSSSQTNLNSGLKTTSSMRWGLILLIISGLAVSVVVIIWLVKKNQPTTLYRI